MVRKLLIMTHATWVGIMAYMTNREVLNKVPGLELIEMAESREDSLCCGGEVAGFGWTFQRPKDSLTSD